MSDETPSEPRQDTATSYPPMNGGSGTGTAISHRSSTKRRRLGIGATMRAEHFDAEGVEAVGEQVGRIDRDQVEELIFQVVKIGQERKSSGDHPDFLLLTEDVDLDAKGMTTAGADGSVDRTGVPNRYDIVESIGYGANGQVFAVFDNNLKREVATKFLHPERAKDAKAFARFVREAQVTASLSHPNILPIYDVDVSDAGLPYFTMRKAEGVSLEDLITRARAGAMPPEISDWFDRAAIMGKVCDAMAYAHDVGVVHQDIKPENILLGRFGQVVLIDWGTAVTGEELASGEYVLQGTPAYMAPEQARRDDIDERTDVYAIGASLFQLLTLRLPTWADDIDSFWELKKAGVIQAPTARERAQIPPPLLAIALRAMEPDPVDRYQRIEDLRDDLQRYQAGESVSAYKDSVTEVIRRVYSRYTAAVWVGLVMMLALAGSIGYYAWEKSKEYSTWRVHLVEDFDDLTSTQLAQDWRGVFFSYWRERVARETDLLNGKRWVLQDGGLLFEPGGGAGCHNLIYRHPLPGNLRFSYDMTPQNEAFDLNCFIAGSDRFDGYTIHLAGWSDLQRVDCTKFTATPEHQLLDRIFLDEPFAVGQTYRVSVEWADERLRLFLDGRLTLDIMDYAPLAGTENQYFGFEYAGSRVLIDNLLVERQLLPQKVSALAVADGLMAEGAWQQAIGMYRGIIDSIDDPAMHQTAAYRIARCLVEMGELMRARASLHTFLIDHPQHQLRHAARALLIDCLLQLGRVDEAEDVMEQVAADPTSLPALKRMVFDRYMRSFQPPEPDASLSPTDRREQMSRSVLRTARLWEQRLAVQLPEQGNIRSALDVLLNCGRAEEVAADWADQPTAATNALLLLGRPEEVLRRYGSNLTHATRAKLALGRYEEVVAENGINRLSLDAYRKLGRSEELLERDDLDGWQRQSILSSLGRYEEMLVNNPDDAGALVALGRGDEVELTISKTHVDSITSESDEYALMVTGRVAEMWPYVVDDFVDRRQSHRQACTLEALRRIRAGDIAGAAEPLDLLDQHWKSVYWLELNDWVLAPMLRYLPEGRSDELLAYWQSLREDPRFASYGDVGPALDTLLDGVPFQERSWRNRTFGPLLMGLHHELAGRRAQAIEQYRIASGHAWQVEDVISRPLAAWRLEQLGAP